MSTLRRFLLFLFLLGPVFHSVAQDDGDGVWRQLLEQWADQNDSENVPDDLVEQLCSFLEYPLNLNDTASDELMLLPFLSDYHRDAIKAYIAQNGEMVTLAELELINGFDSLTVSLLRCFTTVAPVKKNNGFSLKQMLGSGHSNLRSGFKTTAPLARGYKEDIYYGSPFRLYFRYEFKYADRVSFRLSGDKDAGEAFRFASASSNGVGVPFLGFDYYGCHLMVKDMGILKRAIVGKYHLQFGQGVTLWSGFASWMSGSMPLRRFGQGITAASAFCEYGYLRGAAATLSLLPEYMKKSLDLTLFYSNVNRDATQSSSDSLFAEEQQVQSLYSSGYHRTNSELAKKGCLNEQLFGGHLQYRMQNLVVGATAVSTLLGSEIIPADYVYNHFAFSGKENFNCGMDATFRYRRLLLFGEAAMSQLHISGSSGSDEVPLPLSAVAGMQMSFDAKTMLSAAYHYGSPSYQNLHSNTIGQTSSGQNEEGLLLFFQSQLPYYVMVQSSIDLFRFPWMRYRVYSPSSGVDYRLKVSKDLSHRTMLDAQYRYRASQRNSDASLYSIEDIVRQQLQLSLDYSYSDSWRFVSRLVYSWFRCDDHEPLQGFLLLQDATWRLPSPTNPLSLGLRLAIFDIAGYDARIYTYENDLMYEFSVPMLTGRGMRSYLVCHYELSQNLSFALKYAITYYPENEVTGSGYEQIDGGVKNEFKAQFRWRF